METSEDGYLLRITDGEISGEKTEECRTFKDLQDAEQELKKAADATIVEGYYRHVIVKHEIPQDVPR
jgi:hypothetical protein